MLQPVSSSYHVSAKICLYCLFVLTFFAPLYTLLNGPAMWEDNITHNLKTTAFKIKSFSMIATN